MAAVLAQDYASVVSTGGVLVAVLALVYASLRNRRLDVQKADETYVNQLEKRIAYQEDRLKDTDRRLQECERARGDLAERNMQLLYRVLDMEDQRRAPRPPPDAASPAPT